MRARKAGDQGRSRTFVDSIPGARTLFELPCVSAPIRKFGKIHHVVSYYRIRCIDPDTSAILKSDGIRTTVSLLRSGQDAEATAARIADRIGIDEKRVLDWVTDARPDAHQGRRLGNTRNLLRVAGVDTVNELKFRNPQQARRGDDGGQRRRNLVRVLPSERTVQRWIDSAKKLPPSSHYLRK